MPLTHPRIKGRVALISPQVIKKGDVLLEFDGVPIANDGSVHLRWGMNTW